MPGWKFCSTCYKEVHEVLNKVHDDPVDNLPPDENADSDFEHKGPLTKAKT